LAKVAKALALLAVSALLALTALGCGGGSSSTSTTAASTAATAPGATTTAKAPAAKAKAPAAKAQGRSASTKPKPQPSIAEEEAAPGDHSIQEYGSEAEGSESEAVLLSMHSFLTALAGSDYAKVCSGLLASNREQLAQFTKSSPGAPKSCPAVLGVVLSPAAAAEAKRAAAGTVSKVRIGEGTAFVLFRPKGGKLSYFVMKEEGGAWKSTSLTAGSPLVP
jgi:hypothetical protein